MSQLETEGSKPSNEKRLNERAHQVGHALLLVEPIAGRLPRIVL